MARPYSMSRRGAQAAETRTRILDAAIELYRTRGVPHVTMAQIARVAGVSPATVLNHFDDADSLAEAGIGRILESLRAPRADIFAGASTPSERIRRFTSAMFAFYERSSDWFEATRHDLPTLPVLRSATEEFEHAIAQLLRDALGPGFPDPTVAAAVAGLTGPGTLGSLKAAGLSADQAAGVIGDLLAPLVEGARTKD